jgi:hypothetical protein
MSLPEAPASRLAPASNAACAFSVTIRSASRRADLPPTISFIILSAITVFASTANIIKGVNCRRLIAGLLIESEHFGSESPDERGLLAV